ncbi:ATP-binding protein [Streptomyces sp. NPDC058664]|uniref:ATP-binding protein n=1 Tax=unclassified Streptomyces TaxID=2593676 RepID=UPI00365F7797
MIVMHAIAHKDLARQSDSAAGWPTTSTADGREMRVPAPRELSDGPNRASENLEHQHHAVSEARHVTRAVLEGWHMDAERFDAVLLLVSEPVTNAVKHAKPPIGLHRERSGSRFWVGASNGD